MGSEFVIVGLGGLFLLEGAHEAVEVFLVDWVVAVEALPQTCFFVVG